MMKGGIGDEFIYTEKGFYKERLSIGPVGIDEAVLTMEVNRTWQSIPLGRFLGVALYPLEFE